MEPTTDTYHMISLSDQEFEVLKRVLAGSATDPTFPERHASHALGERLFPNDQPRWVFEDEAHREARRFSDPLYVEGLQDANRRQAQLLHDNREKLAQAMADIGAQARTEEELTAKLAATEADVRSLLAEDAIAADNHQGLLNEWEDTKAMNRTLAAELNRAREQLNRLTAERANPVVDHEPVHGVVQDSGGGVFTVLVDRDTETYPAEGMRGYWAAEGAILEGTPEAREIGRLRTLLIQRNRDLLLYQRVGNHACPISGHDDGVTRG